MRKIFALLSSWVDVHNFLLAVTSNANTGWEGLLKICAIEAFLTGVDSLESGRAETVVQSHRLLPSPNGICWAMFSVVSPPTESDKAAIAVDSTCPVTHCRRRSFTRPKVTPFLPLAFF